MSPFSRLTVATLDDAKSYCRHPRKGVLTYGVAASAKAVQAGHQPPNSGQHFRRDEPMILQLPTEIKFMVLGYLEPVWLFQLEEAYPAIAKFLTTSSANKIWYEALPAALLAETEYYQDEDDVHKALKTVAYNCTIVKPEIGKYIDGMDTVLVMPRRLHTFPKTYNNLSQIVLPELDNLSDLAQQTFRSIDTNHTCNENYYPMIISASNSPRCRVLALGGPFQRSISYRREYAGHMHTGKRCYLCFEPLTSPNSFRPEVREWGIRWCKSCLPKWVLTPAELMGVRGLTQLIAQHQKNANGPSVWKARFRSPGEVHWRPFIDDVLRKKVGLDFATTVAKEKYIKQIKATLRASGSPIYVHRRRLRQEIVGIAQKAYSVDFKNEATERACSTFAPAAKIPHFLFHPRQLCEDQMFTPYDPSEEWLEDPTLKLTSSRIVLSRSSAWKRQKAFEMLQALFPDRSTGLYCSDKAMSFLRAADQYHVARISKTVSADATITQLNKVLPKYKSPYKFKHHSTHHMRRLDILLSKLHIHRHTYPHLPRLNAYDLARAKEVFFKKLLLEACVACPDNNLLALPRGIEGMIHHFRASHADRYWESDDWTTIG